MRKGVERLIGLGAGLDETYSPPYDRRARYVSLMETPLSVAVATGTELTGSRGGGGWVGGMAVAVLG